MIEAKVLICYVDKYTGEQHEPGSAVMLEKSRAAELKALGAVDFAEEPKPKAKKIEDEAKEEKPKKSTSRRK